MKRVRSAVRKPPYKPLQVLLAPKIFLFMEMPPGSFNLPKITGDMLATYAGSIR